MQAIPVYGRHIMAEAFRAHPVSWARPAAWREPQKVTSYGTNTYGMLSHGMIFHFVVFHLVGFQQVGLPWAS